MRTESISSEPAISGNAEVSPYREQIASQVKKTPSKGFQSLNIGNIMETTPSDDREKGGVVEAEEALKLIKKPSASDLLRKNEGKEKPAIAAKAKEGIAEDNFENLLSDDKPLVEQVKPVVVTKPDKETNFRELEKKRKEAQDRADRLEQEHSTKDARIKELEATLEKDAFEKSPKFRDTYIKPRDEAKENLLSFVKEIGEDTKLVSEALALKGKERLTYIDDQLGGGAASAEFLRLLTQVDTREREINTATENYKATKVHLAEKEELAIVQDRDSLLKNFDSVSSKLATKLSFFRHSDGDEDHNTAVDSRVAAAKAIITGEASAEDIAVAPFLAVIAKDAIKELKKVREELAKYKARAKEDSSATASVRRGSDDTQQRVKPVGFAGRVGQLAKGL